MATQVSPDIKLAAVGGETRTLGEWLTTFQLLTVVLDPYTNQSAWILDTAERILGNFAGADCRVSFTVTADEDDAKRFLGPITDRILTFCDPDRGLVAGAGITQLPALVHIRQDGTVEGLAQGWHPPEWDAVAVNLAKVMSWSHPGIPAPGDPGPFEGSAA